MCSLDLLGDQGENVLRILWCFWSFWPKNLVFYRVWGAAGLKNLEFYEGQDVPGPETSYFTGSGTPLGLKTGIFYAFSSSFCMFLCIFAPWRLKSSLEGFNLSLEA